MDVYEGKRIKRILRQTRSKIAGLLNAISSAPTSLSSQPSQAVFSSCALPRRTSSRRPVVTFGKQSQKPASSAAAQIYSSSVSHCSGLGIREYRDLGPPLADFARSIRDHFEHEILEKLWTEEDEMELQLNGRIPSLRTLCAFAVGRTAPFIKNVEMDVDFVNDEEAWYEELPYHFRRFVFELLSWPSQCTYSVLD